MKNRMRCLLMFLFLVTVSCTCFPQSIALHAGRSLFPADYIGIQYAHYSNSQVNLSVGLNTETSRKSGLHYTSYGLDLLAQYDFGNDKNVNQLFNVKAGFGSTCQVENEPWVYNGLSLKQRINYGFLAELEGELMVSESFGLLVFAQQKFLFNKALGSTAFAFGIGLRFHLNNF